MGGAVRRYCSNACRQRAYRRRAASGVLVTTPLPQAPRTRGNLPEPTDRFVGRKREMAVLSRMVRRHRLVTIVGPGGAGKTRLAVESASRATSMAWFVELQDVHDEQVLVQAVASTLAVTEQPDEPLIESVISALAGRNSIIVLDNCEHLLDGCAELAEVLLSRCPGCSMLVTSREELQITGEALFRIGSLSVPELTEPLPLPTAAGYDAVRLFVERAKEHVPEFDLTEDNASAVATLCVRLDGLPLAVEMAARWVPMLTVTEIGARLQNHSALLTLAGKIAPSQHRTLRETIDWSHQLLAEDERRALRRLSVFGGGFDLAAAAAVCDGLTETAVLDLVTRLRAKSWVESGPEPLRFRQLSCIRVYGAEQLAAAGERDSTRERLISWLTKLCEPLLHSPMAMTDEQNDRIDRQRDALRAALGWTRADDDRHHLLAAGLASATARRGYLVDGRAVLSRALDRQGRPDYRLVVLDWAAFLAASQDDHAEASRLAEQAMKLALELGDPMLLASVHNTLGHIRVTAGDGEAAIRDLTECARILRAAAEPRALAMVLHNLAWAWTQLGEHTKAAELLDEAVPIYRTDGPSHLLACVLHTQGTLALSMGLTAQARARFLECLEVSSQPLPVLGALQGMAVVAARTGCAARVLTLNAAAEALISTLDLATLARSVYTAELAEAVERSRRELPPDEAAAAESTGKAQSLDETVAYAVQKDH
ncbi:ATP-binding protein [Amycolatopsis sp. NPDC059657]|uniref:ATP-binding protein n=1 Tax=Amycolatopsis sp. NPDC059657 TaxID=3346899 RepID=UPI0036722894